MIPPITRMRMLLSALALCLALAPAAALAHRANVFAWVEEGMIHGEASFAGGKPAMNSRVTVLDAGSGRELLAVTTDESGAFQFKIPEAARESGADLELVLDAGMGHKDSWVVKADEYGGAPGEGAPAPSGAPDIKGAPEPAVGPEAKDLAELAASVRALERRIDEISRNMARRAGSGPGLTEILGGIGYIIGLIGLAAYARSRGK